MDKKTYTYKIAENCEIKADVYGISQDKISPAILFIHGDALIVGQRKHISPHQLEMYTNAGYTLISIDYRLAPETKLKYIIEDIRDAYTWVRQSDFLRIDPNRIAVIGHSAGGYLTLMSGFINDPPPKALVSFYGYGDIVGDWYSRPDPFYCQQPLVPKETALASVGETDISELPDSNNRGAFYLYCRQNGLWPKLVSGHDPDMENSAFDPFCPIRNVTKEYPPTLLLHGDKDTDVPYEQSVIMAQELKRFGVEHELITIPGGGHGFDGAGVSGPLVADALKRVMSFLKKHIG